MWDDRQRQILCLSSCLTEERESANHSAAILNHKKGAPAFWVTSDAELPSWSNGNEAFSLRLLQHQGVVEPPNCIKDSLHNIYHPMGLEVERKAWCRNQKESLRWWLFWWDINDKLNLAIDSYRQSTSQSFVGLLMLSHHKCSFSWGHHLA